MSKHYLDCPVSKDADAGLCTCSVLEDIATANATQEHRRQTMAPAAHNSPADLIRRARQKGLIKPAHTYA